MARTGSKPTEPRGPVLIERGKRLVEHDPSVPHELALGWLEAFPDDLRGKPLPQALARPHVGVIESPLGPLVVKHGSRKGLRARLEQGGLRLSRARRALRVSLALAPSSLPVVRALAALEDRGRPGVPQAVVMPLLPGRVLWEGLPAPPLRPALWRALARTLAELHRAGFRHRDLKAPNLLVEPGGRDIALLDLEGVQGPGPSAPRATRVRDLGRLRVSLESSAAEKFGIGPEDWKTLSEAYLRQAGPGFDPEAWERATGRWARRKIQRNQRSDRPLV